MLGGGRGLENSMSFLSIIYLLLTLSAIVPPSPLPSTASPRETMIHTLLGMYASFSIASHFSFQIRHLSKGSAGQNRREYEIFDKKFNDRH